MKLKYIILPTLILISLISVGVLAAVPTPGDYVSNTGAGSIFSDVLSFFKGLFSGNASIEDAYFISFILYFVIFVAIFMEGIRNVKLFGAKGEVNKQGKIFAVAASALSTFAIFIAETNTGVSTTERLNYLLAPFGVWGGLAIAAIVAYISFKLVHNSDALKEEIMLAIAVAISVGATFAGFLLSLDNLIGWGFLIMLLAMIIAAIRAFTLNRAEGAGDRKAEREHKRQSEINRYKVADDARKKRRERERRETHIRHPKGYMVKAINDCDDVVNSLKKNDKEKAAKKAKEHLHDLKNHLEHATHHLKRIRGKEHGAAYNHFDQLYAHSGTALTLAENIKIPKPTDSDWDNKIQEIENEINQIKPICGSIIQALDEFVDIARAQEDKDNAAAKAASKASEETTKREDAEDEATKKKRRKKKLKPRAVVEK
jgi:hypothetical protein